MSYFEQKRPCISLMGKWQQLYDPKDEIYTDTIETAFNERRGELTVVSIPSVFNVSSLGKKFVGTVWYRRQFTLPAHSGIIGLWMEG